MAIIGYNAGPHILVQIIIPVLVQYSPALGTAIKANSDLLSLHRR